MAHAGGEGKSFSAGAKSLRELGEWDINATRVAEWTVQTGREMKQQQTAMVEEHHRRQAARSLGEPRPTSAEAPENLPKAGVVEMDGGRIRTRRQDQPRGVTDPHWREFQAGCVVRLQSDLSDDDPRPGVPRLFLDRPKVQKLVRQLHRQKQPASDEAASDNEPNADESIGEILAEAKLAENAADQAGVVSAGVAPEPDDSRQKSKRPVRLQRTCVATLEGAEACGRMLAAESARRGIDQAARKGFVGDGQTSIWSVWASAGLAILVRLVRHSAAVKLYSESLRSPVDDL